MLQASVMSFVMYACGFNMHYRFSRQTVLSVNASFSVGSENFAQFIVGQFRGRLFVLKWFYIDTLFNIKLRSLLSGFKCLYVDFVKWIFLSCFKIQTCA